MPSRVINTNVWKDSFIVDLETDEKLLFFYLLSNHMTNIAGIYELSVREMAFDTNIEKERIEEILRKFEKAGKIRYVNGWLALNNWIKHQAKNPKVAVGIERIVENLPDWLKLELLFDVENQQSSLLEDSLSKPMDILKNNEKYSLSKPIALNLTKLNLTKPNANDAAGGSKELSDKQRKRQYAIAMDKEREQETRVQKRFAREQSKPEPIDVDAIYKRRERK